MSSQGHSRRSPFLPVLVVCALGPVLAQCDRDAPPPPPAAPEAVTPVQIPVAPLAPPPPLTRAELINAMAQAASVHAAGATVQGSDPLVGRRFSLRLPFGCGGPAPIGTPADGLAQWTWGPDQETIRLSMTPGDWTAAPVMQGAVVVPDAEDTDATPDGNAWEAVEGFWIARPWLATDACPASRLNASISAPASPETTGIAAVFPQAGSRVARRDGRAYTHTVRAAGDAPLSPPAAGYRLRLEGRIVAFPDGRATACVAYSPDQRPTCVAAVQLDRVAFENGSSDETLSEWRTN